MRRLQGVLAKLNILISIQISILYNAKFTVGIELIWKCDPQRSQLSSVLIRFAPDNNLHSILNRIYEILLVK